MSDKTNMIGAAPLTIGSLFSGYLGLDLGVRSVFPGAREAWVSDVDKGANKILAHRVPGVPNLGDITAIDWATVPRVDIITGGSPCQDLSTAGRRAGMTDGTRSNLWVPMREAIAQLKPRLVVWENVRGALSASASSALEHCPGCMGGTGHTRPPLRALGRVLGDLADLGYDAQWYGLRAADLGACHGRFRIFVVAYPHGARLQGQPDPTRTAPTERQGRPVAGAGRPDLALLPTPAAGLFNDGESADTWLARRERVKLTANNGNGMGMPLSIAVHANRWGEYAEAIARHEHAFGHPAPAPTEPGPKGNPRLSARFVEWMMMLPAGWVTDTPGISRKEALRALGNGVVSAQAAQALAICLSRAGV